MLRVTIELVPHGEEQLKRILDQAIIYNDGTGDHSNGNYVATLQQKRVTIEGFARADSAWELLRLVLNKTASGAYQEVELGQVPKYWCSSHDYPYLRRGKDRRSSLHASSDSSSPMI